MWIIIIVLIIALVVLFWQISNLISVLSGSLYVKSDRDVVRKALKLADIKKDAFFYDLGSGNGDALIEASKYKAKCVGFEVSPYYFVWSKLRTIFLSDIKIKFKNIKTADLSRADIVYLYLLPSLISKINFSTIKKTAKIISIGFPIKNLKLSKKVFYRGRNIFIYS